MIKEEWSEEVGNDGVLSTGFSLKPQNKSGVYPVEYKVLIKPEVVEERTAGGLYLPDQTKDKDQMAQVKGTLIAVGGNAFEDWEGAPEVGNKVYFAKYAGYVIKGEDGEEYRLANDKDIAAIIK